MDAKTKPVYQMFLLLSGGLFCLIEYYYAFPLWDSLGFSGNIIRAMMLDLYTSGVMKHQPAVRLICLFFCIVALAVRNGKSKESHWIEILLPLLGGLGLFLGSGHLTGIALVLSGLAGYIAFMVGAILLGRKVRAFDANLSEYHDTFEQCERKVESDLGVNIPMRYQYRGQIHNGWINVVSPQRGCLILGTPGSGKTYSIYGPFIRQMVQKGYSMFVYDYKFPDLAQRVMNELQDNYDCYDVKPKMYIVNFDDPAHSHRFNPLHPRYLTDPIDATEIAELIMKNVNRGNGKDEGDFFDLSARCYIDLLIWFLKIYEGGRYCTFPHLIELMGQDYRDVFEVLKRFPELEVKRNTFADAIRDQAFEQLQGQIASARVPLNRFASPTVYWTLTGDDFSLDINDPLEPKIVCVGNNPKRQSIYGTTLALLTSQLFKQINNPGKRHSAVLIDELPTIYLKGLDNLIDTARSNKVAVVIGAQDKSQLVRDYDKKESDVIFNTVGNVFAGAVKGQTADDLSKSFGKEDRETRSYQEDDSSDKTTYAYQLRDILPAHKIEALSQGYFCGYIADTHDRQIHPKIFCGEVLPGGPPHHHDRIPTILDCSRDDLQAQIEVNYMRIRCDIVTLLQKELTRPDEPEEEMGDIV